MKRIYFDNAATTPMLPEVIDVMTEIMMNEFGNPSSIHYHGRKARSVIENARKSVARLLNASVGEIFFTGSATESNNTILKTALESLGVKRFISSPTEHPCVLKSLAFLKKNKGTEVLFLDVDELGNPDLSQLESLLSGNKTTTLVSLMHGNNEIGTISDLQAIADICHRNQAFFHTDTVQTLGKYPIDLNKTRISFLSGSAHKFHGPKGTGFMYINQENTISPYIHGGSQERNMRAGTENVAGIAGLSKALEISCAAMEENRRYILTLRETFKGKLEQTFSDIRFNGNQEGDFLTHVLNVSFPPGPKADMLVHNLDIAGISCSSASACSSGVEEDSHVLQSIGHDPNRKAIRFSFSHLNTLEEVEEAITRMENLTPKQ